MGGAAIGGMMLGCIICGALTVADSFPQQASPSLGEPTPQAPGPLLATDIPAPSPTTTYLPPTQVPNPTPIPLPSPTEEPEGPLAEDFELSSAQGQSVRLTDYRGNVVLINFWATWCFPCVAEMPAIQDRFEKYQDQGFVVLAINSEDSLNEILAFASDHGLTFPFLLDAGGRVEADYRVRAYPTSFFVSRGGVILAQHVGMMEEQRLDNYLAQAGIGP
ncbi:MAG: redoxin domain-containing protein [Anaerolineales bacterium]